MRNAPWQEVGEFSTGRLGGTTHKEQTQQQTPTYEPGEEPVSSDKKFEILAAEADGFYKTIVTVSTAILGGTLIFLEKVAPVPTRGSIWMIGSGWLLLFAAILCISYVRRQNLESLRLALRGEYDKAKPIDVRTRRASTAAPWLMVVGMAFVALSGLMNLWAKTHKPGGMVTEDKSRQESIELPLSISSGDSGPKRAPIVTQPVPASPDSSGGTKPAGTESQQNK